MSARPLPDNLRARLELAAEVFAERGLDATRIDDVAKATGIPRATLYYYFPGKEHILAHLLGRTLTAMTARLEAAASAPGTGRRRVERLVHEHLAFIASHGPTYRLLFAELGKAASLIDIAAGVDRAVLAPLRAALRQAVDDRSLAIEDVAVTASVVYGAVLVAGMETLLRDDGDLEAAANRRAEALLKVLLSGLEPREEDVR
jgi:AcrR family transcriptional regulator